MVSAGQHWSHNECDRHSLKSQHMKKVLNPDVRVRGGFWGMWHQIIELQGEQGLSWQRGSGQECSWPKKQLEEQEHPGQVAQLVNV